MASGRFSRKIIGLLSAAQLLERPKSIPKSRPRGAKADGLRYERALAKALAPYGFIHGLWFEFVDANGHGYCSPDLVAVQSDRVLVVEAKLTDGEAARHQLQHLYRPVLEKVFRKPVHPVVALRHATYETGKLHDSIETVLSRSVLWPPPVLHWLGRGPIA